MIIAFLAFFMMSFNEYRYELFVAETFTFGEGEKIKEENFHFLMYLKYSLFDWIKTLGCCEPDWPDCKRIDMAREEAVEQIDVKMLLRRVAHLERLNKTSVSESEDLCTYLIEGENILEIRKRRKVAEYYEKIVKGSTTPLTMENMDITEQIFNIGTELFLNKPQGETTGTNQFFRESESPNDKLERALARCGSFIEVDESELELEDEDLEIELALSNAFFSLPSRTRERIQEKIPLKILKRLKDRYDENAKKRSALSGL